MSAYTPLLLLQGVIFFLNILGYVLIIDMLLSWFMPPFHPVRSFLGRVTGPIIAPFRPIGFWLMRVTGLPMDFSGLIAYFAIRLIISLIGRTMGVFM